MEEESKKKLEEFFNTLVKNKFKISEVDLNDLIIKSSEIHTKISGYEFRRSISPEDFITLKIE